MAVSKKSFLSPFFLPTTKKLTCHTPNSTKTNKLQFFVLFSCLVSPLSPSASLIFCVHSYWVNRLGTCFICRCSFYNKYRNVVFLPLSNTSITTQSWTKNTHTHTHRAMSLVFVFLLSWWWCFLFYCCRNKKLNLETSHYIICFLLLKDYSEI